MRVCSLFIIRRLVNTHILVLYFPDLNQWQRSQNDFRPASNRNDTTFQEKSLFPCFVARRSIFYFILLACGITSDRIRDYQGSCGTLCNGISGYITAGTWFPAHTNILSPSKISLYRHSYSVIGGYTLAASRVIILGFFFSCWTRSIKLKNSGSHNR